jgi:uncharacterized protein (DUF4415 family)
MLSDELRRKRNAAHDKWDKDNTKQIKCKFNLRTDDDILKHLQKQGNVQGYLKRLIREDIARHQAQDDAAKSFQNEGGTASE